jgi:ESS family glutamate:Na+ symporter
MVLQNLTGMSVAMMVDLDRSVGVLAGSVSLVGGHGTAIAWAPDFVELGIANALEIGVASATLGLIIASLIGGPIARWLINRNHLSASGSEAPMVGIEYEKAESETINHMSFISVLLTLHIAIILGYAMNEFVSSLGFKLPLFVSCLLMAILLSNTVPRLLPRIRWPARTRALAVLSDYSLGLFLAMSLMSMQLWTIAGLAGPLLIILLLQTTIAVIFILFILFPLMGRDYQAAVLSAGFGGFAMGATPTAIANMTAVTKAHGPAPTAFIILPLVAAFFVDIANAFIIRFALTL